MEKVTIMTLKPTEHLQITQPGSRSTDSTALASWPLKAERQLPLGGYGRLPQDFEKLLKKPSRDQCSAAVGICQKAK